MVTSSSTLGSGDLTGRPARRLSAVLAVSAALTLAGCIGPQESHRPPYDGPTGPTRAIETQLRGQVLETGTNVPVAGAKVDAGEGSAISDSLGNYNIQHLRLMAATLVTTKAGYDTARAFIPLDGGDKSWVVRITPRAP